ncbi:FAS1 domain-containing protein [Sporodiniella umbellata]|nr:FAS1 domain-containing protein [Sporodiniella umbellata]
MKILLPLLVFLSSSMAQKLLYEPNAPDYRSNRESQSLFDRLAPDPSLSTFIDVLNQSEDFFNLFNQSGPEAVAFTVFCPINSAFRKELDVDTRKDLISFLKYHIVPNQKLDKEALARTTTLNTFLNGQSIQVQSADGQVLLAQNVHLGQSIETAYAIAYKIDHLLHP